MLSSGFEIFNFTVSKIVKSIQKIKNDKMTAFGLRGAHAMCLFQLRSRSDGLTTTELADICEVDKAAISRVVSELEKQGHISSIEQAGKKKYRVKLFLTDSGKKIADEISKIVDDVVDSIAAGITKEDREAFLRTLMLISSNLQSLAVKA